MSEPEIKHDADKSETNEDELASICTLGVELNNYLGRDSSSRYHEVYPGAERIEYDFAMERRNVNSTNLLESTSHLIKGCLGAGILSMHEAYMHGGLWASVGATSIVGTIVVHNMYMLVSSAQKLYTKLRVPRLTYPDLVEAAVAAGPLKCCRKYSKIFRYIIELFLFLQLCGTCSIYQIMIAKTLKQELEAIWPTWNLSLRTHVLIYMPALLIVCMIRNLKYLAPFSIVADLFIAICVTTAMYYSLSEAGPLNERPAFKSFPGILRFCGIFLYSIDGVGITMPIENNMKSPQYYSTVLQFGMGTVIIAVTLVGFFGYWGYGERCRSPFTIQMPLQTLPIIMQFLLIAILTVTFAVNFFIPFRIIWHYLGKGHKRKRGEWERAYRGLLVSLITCLSIANPNFINLMIFMGTFFISFISFMFPALVNTLVIWTDHSRRHTKWYMLKNIFIFAFGVLLNIGSFFSINN